jgi:hypothetical protein
MEKLPVANRLDIKFPPGSFTFLSCGILPHEIKCEMAGRPKPYLLALKGEARTIKGDDKHG